MYELLTVRGFRFFRLNEDFQYDVRTDAGGSTTRIDADNGNHGNQVMWRYGTGLLPATAAQVAAVTLNSFLTMDNWLSNLNVSAAKATLNSARAQAEVIAAKPATAFDLCYLTGDTTFSTPVTDMAACDADPRLAKHSSPRQVAGADPQISLAVDGCPGRSDCPDASRHGEDGDDESPEETTHR